MSSLLITNDLPLTLSHCSSLLPSMLTLHSQFSYSYGYVTITVPHAVLGTKLVREEDFYKALGDVHDAMLWLGAQL